MRSFILTLLLFCFFSILKAQAPCEIFNLTVATGDCTGDLTYTAVVNFEVSNTTNASFDLWANGTYMGNYPLSALPLTIQNFPYNGGVNDVVKVCINDNANCCRTKEFPVPACITNPQPCEIVNLTVATGDCTGDSTYAVVVNFEVSNTTNASFDLWANGTYVGNYPLSALPLTIQNFPYNGGVNDVVKVCINDNANCCKVKEFPVPACITNSEPCEIYDLTVITGDCTGDSTYQVKIDFEVSNTTNALFDLWANGTYVGNYPLSALPLTIQNFPYNGGVNDVVKVCINDNANCCKVKEFPVPACITNSEPCEIFNLTVTTGDCWPDSTYFATINFGVQGSTNGLFDLWANGIYVGNYPLSALPLTIQHFPYNGGVNDVVKVCINDNPNCCQVKEFPVPSCFLGNCVIDNLLVQTTACVCGKFFAVITFDHENGSNDGFDIGGNGVNYGNFAYSQQQPIILGPLEGDNTTPYEFVVRDHSLTGCKDAVEVGKIDCPESPTFEIINNEGNVQLAPNPATSSLSVTATLRNGTLNGSGQVSIISADGRVVKNISVNTAASFSINIGDLPPGTYELVLDTDLGRLTGKFSKI